MFGSGPAALSESLCAGDRQ